MRAALLFLCAWSAWAQSSRLDLLNQRRPVLDAHNCYPYEGEWADRIERVLQTGFPMAIEQDLTWGTDPQTGKPAPVLSHHAETKGGEPTLRTYFFQRIRPLLESAPRSTSPTIILHLDFKSEEPALLRAVWDLLGEYESWITTAPKTANSDELPPLDVKPLLVLTEDSDAQEAVFYTAVPAGSRLRLFGSAHSTKIAAHSDQERWHKQATIPPGKLLTERPTNYRRWWNNSWYVVEEGGQKRAGEWSARDDARLRALVGRAHQLGYWIRFFTLDGFTPAEDKGWDANYNFGSLDAVKLRWRAAAAAGVDFISTDQYEELAGLLHQHH